MPLRLACIDLEDMWQSITEYLQVTLVYPPGVLVSLRDLGRSTSNSRFLCTLIIYICKSVEFQFLIDLIAHNT